jgi:hypothetical protein
MVSFFMRITLALLALALSACAPESGTLVPEAPKPKTAVEYPLNVEKPWTTLRGIWLPIDAPYSTSEAIYTETFTVDDLGRYGEMGLAGLELGPGEPHVRYTPFGDPVTAADPRSLLYFAQLSDTHITDSESPVRLEGVTRIAFASAYRANDNLTTQMLDAVLRSLNLFSFEDRPYDFLFLTGDLSDNAQENELFWFREVMDGGLVQPDSGAIDDPIPGPGNDFTDPFIAGGLDPRVPYYVIPGNHDTSYLGTFDPTPRVLEALVGDRIDDFYNFGAFSNGEVTFGVRDASRPYGPVIREGRIEPDPRRRMLFGREVMQMFITSPTLPPGHGFTQHNLDLEIATYVAQPAANFPLTMIAIDTAMEMILDDHGKIIQHASASGEIDRDMWESIVVPALEKAQADNHLIIIASHHCTASMADYQSEITSVEMRQTFSSYPNVIAHFCGHGHRTEMWTHAAATDATGPGYVEMMQASTIDFPIQGRIWELVDNQNGTLSLFSTQVEPNVSPGMLTWDGLMYAAASHNFPLESLFPSDNWNRTKPYRNMEIVLPVPAPFASRLSGLTGFGAPESTTRLAE